MKQSCEPLTIDASAGGFADADLHALARRLGEQLSDRRWQLTLAESCTGGWIAKVLTDVPGSSAWFELGIVSYSNVAKQQVLGVSGELLQRHGAVSAEVVTAMAEGALRLGGADLAVAVSGIAGPGGAVEGKPVGTVWLGWASRDGTSEIRLLLIRGDREQVRRATVAQALNELLGCSR